MLGKNLRAKWLKLFAIILIVGALGGFLLPHLVGAMAGNSSISAVGASIEAGFCKLYNGEEKQKKDSSFGKLVEDGYFDKQKK